MKACPVCGCLGIPVELTRCPQCHAGLEGSSSLTSLPDDPRARAQRSRKQLIWMGAAGLLIVVLIFLAAVSLYRVRQLESHIERLQTALADSQANLDARPQTVPREEAKPEQRVSAMPPPAAVTSRETGARFRKHPMPDAPSRESQPAGALSAKVVHPVPAATGVPAPPNGRGTEKEPAKETEAPGQKDGTSDSSDELPAELAEIPPLEPQPALPEATGNSATASPEPTVSRDQSKEALGPPLPGKSGKKLTAPPRNVARESLPREGGTPDQAAGFWVYEAKESDTFWNVSQMFYGTGYYYPVLMEHNPEIGLFGVGEGVRLKILKDAAQAKRVFQKIVKKEGKRRIWYYTVAAGDTPEAIAMKFYKTDEKAARVRALNPGLKMQPGERIRIQLE